MIVSKKSTLVFQSITIRLYAKAIKYISWLLNVRFKLENIKESDIVIFEKTNEDYLIPLCENYSYRLLDINFDTLQINLKVSFNTLSYIFLGYSIKSSYLAALINQIKPKTVITFIDNSDLFYLVSRILHKDIFFLAIQNAARYDVFELPELKSKKIHIPNFACFGEYEKDMYTKKKAIVENFIPVGSLRDSYYRDYLVKKKNRSTKQFDICVVAEASPGWDAIYPGFEDAVGKIAQYAVRYCDEKKLSLVIAGKRDLNNGRADFQTFDNESNWYRNYIGTNVEITPRVRDEFTTYQLVDQSRISLAMISTCLYEGAGRGNRVLFSNFSNFSQFDFPVKGLLSINTDCYELFSERITEILSYTDSEYHDKTKSIVDYVIHNNDEKQASSVLKKIISESISIKR